MGNVISIESDFTLIKFAKVKNYVVEQIFNGELENGEILDIIEDSETYCSMYGVDFANCKIQLDCIFEHTDLQDGWYEDCVFLKSYPSEMFVDGFSLELSEICSSDPIVMLIENYSGVEFLSFNGEFENNFIKNKRLKFKCNETILADIIQVRCGNDSEVDDQTEIEGCSVYIFQNGKLSEIDQ